MEVVREMEAEGLSCSRARQKYGIGGRNTVEKWARKYGKGLIGKVIRVETPQEVNELKKAKERIKRLESLLADTNLGAGAGAAVYALPILLTRRHAI